MYTTSQSAMLPLPNTQLDFGIEFSKQITNASIAYNIDPALITAIIHAESNFNPKARSYAGAKGLMQINDITQRHLGITDIYNPDHNIDAGSRYIKELMQRFHGNIRFTIAAYNAGPGSVRRYKGIPPYMETQRYVKKVMAYFQQYQRLLASHQLTS